MTKEDCFVIMPITTPDDYQTCYQNDSEHFIHVMEHLFKPAIEKAGLNPIFPVTKGSEVIHADIISKIESSHLVLCDMSILNPNVFFELGIRTALNKSVCLVKDDVVKKVPFDTSIINSHTYSCELSPWILDDEIKKLSSHITDTLTKGGNFNSLWKYFSLSSIAHSAEPKGSEDQTEYLNIQMEATRKQLENIQMRLDRPSNMTIYSNDVKRDTDSLNHEIVNLLSENVIIGYQIRESNSNLQLKTDKSIDAHVRDRLASIGKHYNYILEVDKDNNTYNLQKLRPLKAF